jgi:hypothetical protein
VRRAAVIAGLVFALGLPSVAEAATADAAARSFTIRVRDGAVSAIGSFRPRTDPTIAAATRAFGAPSSRKLTDPVVCRVRWRALKLTIYFANLGGQDPCSDEFGLAGSVVVKGSRFRTWKGLRVGNRGSAVKKKHPAARFREGTWWLKTATSQIGDGSEFGVLRATVSSGKVRRFDGVIGAAGD